MSTRDDTPKYTEKDDHDKEAKPDAKKAAEPDKCTIYCGEGCGHFTAALVAKGIITYE
jgi:ATP:corrinoid adenosyltransferase